MRMTTTMSIPSAPKSRGSGCAISRVVVRRSKVIRVCPQLLRLSSFKKESCYWDGS